mgnify:CR=1 FL=1
MRALFLVLSLLIFSCATEPNHEPAHAHLKTLFPQGILNTDLSPVALNTLNDKVIAFYFITMGNPHEPTATEIMSTLAVNYSYRFNVIVVNPHNKNEQFLQAFTRYKDVFYRVNTAHAQSLTKKYQIKSAPSVVVLDTEGKLITLDGLDTIIDNTPRLPGGWN